MVLRIGASVFAILLLARGAAGDLVPNDPYYPPAWHHAAIHSAVAWGYSTGSPAIRVAVLDTGVYADHPDLAGRVVTGYNVLNDNTNTSPTTQEGAHGTGEAGIMAAGLNNGIGVAGMGNFGIVPVRIAAGLSVFSDDMVAGLNWVADHAQALNIRVALDTFYEVPQTSGLAGALQRLRAAGVLVVGSLPNDGQVIDTPTPNMLLVAGIDQSYALRPVSVFDSGSDWGHAVDLVAPSTGIYTAYYDPTGQSQALYALGTGNSWAAPQVAGAAALLWSINPQLTVDQVQSILLNTAHDLGAPGRDDVFGYGLLDVGAAAATAALPEPSTGAALLSALAIFWLARRLRTRGRWI